MSSHPHVAEKLSDDNLRLSAALSYNMSPNCPTMAALLWQQP